jgi:GMP synthase-like glutamine amidotransferase
MRTLLIDNGSTLTKKLAALSPGAVDVFSYDQIPDTTDVYSLIILSGSSLFPIEGSEHVLGDEIKLIQTSNIPIVGICLGHEMIAHAFGAKLEHFKEKHIGTAVVDVVSHHSMFLEKESFSVYENHQFGIVENSPELETLARTDHAIAALKHKTKSIYGLQFHPEHHMDEHFGDEVFLKLIDSLV